MKRDVFPKKQHSSGINYRVVKQLDKTKPSLIIIPGGPGLAADYFYGFAEAMASGLEVTIKLVDWPNGSERVDWNYQQTLDNLADFLTDEQKNSANLSVLGHSMGGVFLADLMQTGSPSTEKLIFVNTPSDLSLPPEYLAGKEKLVSENPESDQEEFRLTLPLYFRNQPSKETEKLLLTNYEPAAFSNCFAGFPIEKSIYSGLVAQRTENSTLIIGSSNDKRLGSNNLKSIKQLITGGTVIEMPESGHFPMLEDVRQLSKICLDFLSS